MKLDFNKTPSNAPMQPDRVYGAEIVSAQEGISQGVGAGASAGNPILNLQLLVTDNAGDPEANNRRINQALSLQEHALFSVMSLLQALGYDVNSETDDFEIDWTEIEGRDVGFSIRNQKYLGEERSSVRRFWTTNQIGKSLDEIDEEMGATEELPALSI